MTKYSLKIDPLHRQPGIPSPGVHLGTLSDLYFSLNESGVKRKITLRFFLMKGWPMQYFVIWALTPGVPTDKGINPDQTTIPKNSVSFVSLLRMERQIVIENENKLQFL